MFERNLTDGANSLQTAVQRYFEIALYLLVATGFMTLATTGGLDFPTLVIVTLVLFVRGFLLFKSRPVVMPESWTTYLTLIYVAFYFTDYFLLSGSFINSTVHLVLFVVLVRLFSLRRNRDHYTLAMLSFLMVLAAAVLTVDSIFLLAFAVFLLVAIATFMLMEMRHSSATVPTHAREDSGADLPRRMGFSVAGITPIVLCIVLGGGAGIFFLLPRASSRFLTSYTMGTQVVTGFSDRVQLGTIGQIQQSNAVVMRVRIEGDPTGKHNLMWRGISLSLFDGHVWSNPFEQTVLGRAPDGGFHLAPNDEPLFFDMGRQTVRYHVMMEPIGAKVFFLAPRGKSIEGRYRSIARDEGEAVFNLDDEQPVTIYEAESDITKSSPDRLRSTHTNIPRSIAMAYLQLPALDIRIPRLADQIITGQETAYDKAAAIEQYLQTHFQYTLQLPRFVPRDPLANFLFERKQGHCEYFASTMAVMLRSLNIPSRVVNGFRTTEFNDLTGQYVIRASSAHSWVEAYFPGQGWVGFDPTPAATPPANTGWNRFLLYVDAASSFWREWVVNYDATHQRSLGQQAARHGRESLDRFRVWSTIKYQKLLTAARRTSHNFMSSPWRWMATVLGSLGLFLLLINAGKIWAMAKSRLLLARPEREPQQAAALWYSHLMKLLGRRGWNKKPSDTPTAFVRRINDVDLRRRVDRFTQAYESARFGTSADDARALPELYEQIEKTLKSGKSLARTGK